MVVHVHFNDKQYAAICARSEAEGITISGIVKSAVVVMLRLDKSRYKVHLSKRMLAPIVPPEDTNADL